MGVNHFPVAHMNGADNRIAVNVAILDTGIDTNHPDLNIVQAVEFTGSGDPTDWDGHGTEVAGIIGALDNTFGVVGVAPGARLWSVQVLGPTPDQSSWGIAIAGMDYVAQRSNQIEVVNCSFGNAGCPWGNAPYNAVYQAVHTLASQGIVVVAGVGNCGLEIAGRNYLFGDNDDFLPAALTEVMAVSAMDPTNDAIAAFSNFSSFPHPDAVVNSPGGAIDVAAPGVNILSTSTNHGYAMDSGTSMAAPHAAGLVALYIAANGRAHTAQDVYNIRQAIVDNSLQQSDWNAVDTMDPDPYLEPLAIPSENWVPLPIITAQANTPAGFQLSFRAVPGYNYTAQYNSSLGLLSGWTNLTSITGTGAVASVTIGDPAPSPPRRFYRLLRQPAP
jgi:subtilisin family serine protease